VDTFVVGGVQNRVPVICGDNDGQHMYLQAPSSTTDLLLMFSFGAANVARSWNIKISFIPCGNTMIAPKDCLQYFTQSSGSVRSFNWRDTSGLRQLANQDYKVCFRNELIANKRATRICYSTCSVTNGGNPFELSTLTAPNSANSAVGTSCLTDYFILPDASDTTNNVVADRFCGNTFNTAASPPGAATPLTICSTVKDFSFIYRTDSSESADELTALNTGYCLTFEQRLN